MPWPFLAGSGPGLSKCLPSGAFFNGAPAEWGVLSLKQNACLRRRPVEEVMSDFFDGCKVIQQFFYGRKIGVHGKKAGSGGYGDLGSKR